MSYFGGDGKRNQLLDGVLSAGETAILAKELVEPGKTPRHTLFRTRFIDDNEAKLAVLAMSELEEFELAEEKNAVIDLLCAKTSVGNQGNHNRSYMLLEAITGLLMTDGGKGILAKGRKDNERTPAQTGTD